MTTKPAAFELLPELQINADLPGLCAPDGRLIVDCDGVHRAQIMARCNNHAALVEFVRAYLDSESTTATLDTSAHALLLKIDAEATQ